MAAKAYHPYSEKEPIKIKIPRATNFKFRKCNPLYNGCIEEPQKIAMADMVSFPPGLLPCGREICADTSCPARIDLQRATELSAIEAEGAAAMKSPTRCVQDCEDDGYDSSHTCSTAAETTLSASKCSEDASFETASETYDPMLALELLSTSERARLILPIVSEWVRIIGLTRSVASFDRFHTLIAEHPSFQDRGRKQTVSEGSLGQLKQALGGLPLPELVPLLKTESTPVSLQIAVDTLAYEIQLECDKQHVPQRKQKKQAMKQRRRW